MIKLGKWKIRWFGLNPTYGEGFLGYVIKEFLLPFVVMTKSRIFKERI